MPNPTRALLATAVFAVLALGLTACSSIPAIPAASGPLVTVSTRGGECLDGPCGSTTIIERDGRVHQTVPAGADLGQVPADILTALDAAIKTADFDVIRAVQFDAECPVNFDGQEFIYEFGAPGGVERVASCETRIDPAHPLFAAVNAALVAVGAPPAP
ncbi:MAG: hypothetical protein ABIQ58_01550 [Candidatus Limnocylindrales bacterium]